MKHALILVLFFAGFFYLHRHTAFGGPYTYDEADYMFAARLGLAANYTDSPTMSIADFIAAGLNRGRDPGNRSDLSQSIRNSNDIVFYRHWHGPLYYYWLCAIDVFHLDERSVRRAGLIWFGLTGLVVYFGAIALVPGNATTLAGILALAMFLWSRTALGSPELAPHCLFALCALVSLIALVKAVQTSRRSYWFAAVITAAAAFATMEMTFVLILTLAACAWFQRKPWLIDTRFIVHSILTFLAAAALLWPGALLKLSFIKAYFFMAYLALFRKSPWGDTTFWETWQSRFTSSPVEWFLIAIALGLLIRYRNRMPVTFLYPVAIFCGLMILATLRVNSTEPRYALMFDPELDLLAACVIAVWLTSFPESKRTPAVLLLSVCLFLPGFLRSRNAGPPDPQNRALLAFIREHQLAEKALLVPQADVPMLHYYFPGMRLSGFVGEQPTLDGQHVDGVILPGFPIRYQIAGSQR